MMMENNSRPDFSLTPDEVEIVKYHFTKKHQDLVRMLQDMDLDPEKYDMGYIRWKCEFKETSHILNRIKQWQDEQDKCNHPVDKG